ncbi:G-protein coupled receptor Mth2 isoform X2 [Nomia melanderi]|uniref:G-protein coupled receptor Mth2 isoform X2 n=1 Tax=Nomia melanderi TaxID=2448451 RepID=UPI003FCDA626
MARTGLLWIGLLAWTIWPCHGEELSCCMNDTASLVFSNCSTDTRARLHCPYGSFMVDPAIEDDFTIIRENGESWLQLADLRYPRIPSNMFCVAKLENSSTDVALVCFDNDSYSDHPSIWRETLFCILGIISATFLIATLAVYVVLPELREVQDKAMMAVVTSLAVGYIVLSIENLRPQEEGDEELCISLGFLLYFSFMSVFFWLNIVSFNVWRTVWFKNFRVREKPLFIAYCIYGWGGSLCFLVLALLTHNIEGTHLKPGFGERSCWFNGPKAMWAYFYGPILILLILNVVYLGMTGWRLWHQCSDYNGNKLRALRFKCMLYIKLILVMGVTWIFEVASYAEGPKKEIWIPTDILNALQGLIIFLLLVATRKRVRKLLARKRPCGIAFPKSWAVYEDEECEDVMPEEIELSQHD